MIKLIGVSGVKGSGKDTFAQIVNEERIKEGKKPYRIMKFASALKTIAGYILDIDIAYFEDPVFKTTSLGPEWKGMTVREFLQKLGTEVGRNINEDIWVNILFNKCNESDEDVIITDVRFENEASRITSMGGIVVNIVSRATFEEIDNHPSEKTLPLHFIEEHIGNFGSLSAYTDAVREFYHRKLK